MSFIYARNLKNKIYVFSDSKLSISPEDKDRLIKTIGKENYNNVMSLGVIKNVIINKNICVASAWILEDFNKLLEMIDNNKLFKIEEICLEALKIHCDKNGRTDFIVALSDTTDSKLYEIKNGSIEEVQTSWLGIYECFKNFQRLKEIEKENSHLSDSDIEQLKKEYACFNRTFNPEQSFESIAFQKTVNSNIDNSVGGYVVECIGECGIFQYNELFSTHVEREQIVLPGNNVKIHDSVFDGGYSYHVYQSNNNYKVYILQLGKGIIYEPNIKDRSYNHLRMPNIYNMSESEFINKAEINEISVSLV